MLPNGSSSPNQAACNVGVVMLENFVTLAAVKECNVRNSWNNHVTVGMEGILVFLLYKFLR